MRALMVGFGSAVLASAICSAPALAQQPPPAGWAAELGGGGASPITTHAEFAALSLEPSESPHPEVAPADLSATFLGDVRCARAGRYRFGLHVEGATAELDATLKPGGEATRLVTVAAQDGANATGAPSPDSWSPFVEVAAGQTLRLAVHARRAGSAPMRVQTSWEMQAGEGRPGFAAEPIPSSVVRVPADRIDAVARELEARHGRVLLAELGCANCHLAEGAAPCGVERRGPIALERVAARAGREWLRKWLLAPQTMKPGCGMPALLGEPSAASADVDALLDLFESTARGGAEAAAPPPAPAADALDAALLARGDELYHEVGCVACHGPLESPARAFGDEHLGAERPAFAAPAPFGDLAGKWRATELAAFLRDPVSIRSHGRMPSLGLDENEAAAIAADLVQRFGAAPPVDASAAPDPARVERGRALFAERGCADCHTLGDEKAAAASKAPPISKLEGSRGCLAANAAARGAAPRYELDAATRAALAAGLASVRRARGTGSPIDATQRTLVALHCTACHARDDTGGMPEPLLAYCRSRVEADLGDEGRLPPKLDGVGIRLQSPWIEQVVSDGARARPYLGTRMPHFGGDVAKVVATGLAEIEGVWRSDEPRLSSNPTAPPPDKELMVAGRKLAGSGGLSCITCHSFGNRPSAGTPGLDFLQFAKRIRGEWWRTYALSPLRFKPGTRMPTFFEDGKSAAVAILDGDATQQIDALWAWFETAGDMPAPEGVPSGQRMVLDVGDRPKIFRTFLERAGSRGIAIGFPSGLHFAFDADQIRLCEAWRGEFLDVAPVWTGRGGNVAPQLGPIVWSAPAGPALLLQPPASDWPSDSGRAHGLKFRGYELDADGTPTFLWELRPEGTPAEDPPRPDAVEVAERFVPDLHADVLFRRTFTLSGLKRAQPVLLHLDGKSRVAHVENGELETPRAAGAGGTEAGAPGGVDFVSVVDPKKPCVVEVEVRS